MSLALLRVLTDPETQRRHDAWVTARLTGLRDRMMEIRRRTADAAMSDDGAATSDDGADDPAEGASDGPAESPRADPVRVSVAATDSERRPSAAAGPPRPTDRGPPRRRPKRRRPEG